MGTFLNIGSGQRKFAAPWINVDKQEKWTPDVVWDAGTEPCPFEDGSASIIVLHHVLEHYGCNEADGLLKMCYRLLETRGSLLVFVPHMWDLTSMWREGVINTQIFMTNVYGAYMGDEADRHKWGYEALTLSASLRHAGFPVTVRFDWRPIEGADISKARWILGMEAIK